MCRLFAFRSVLKSQVHESLIDADDGLSELSHDHPDGWGVAYYVEDTPHIIKSEKSAFEDHIFKKVSGVASSETVLAHIRSATLGGFSQLNTHPFQYGKWVFAHNGNISNWDTHKEKLLTLINIELKPYLLGETDSETLFFIFLSFLKQESPLDFANPNSNQLFSATRKALKAILSIIGPFSTNSRGPDTDTYLTFIFTNGNSMVAFHGGKDLFYSTYKNLCPQASSCPFFDESCHAAPTKKEVNHLLLASAPITGDNVWIAMKPGELIISELIISKPIISKPINSEMNASEFVDSKSTNSKPPCSKNKITIIHKNLLKSI